MSRRLHQSWFTAGLGLIVATVAAIWLAACGGASTGSAAQAGGSARATGGASSALLSASQARAANAVAGLDLSRRVGQLVVATYPGAAPPASILAAVREGAIGAIFLNADNTRDSVAVTRAAVARLQGAARAGGQPGLLILTDQEGGEVKRLAGAPSSAAAGMADPSTAAAQGAATGTLLRRAGVNVDLAPVADVTRVDGFEAREHRDFGSDPARVAAAACAFAGGLAKAGIAYTLKHFPGLGDAVSSTDDVPVAIHESAAQLQADTAAYRRCGSGPRTLVMVSSASYPALTGSLPAVMSPAIYGAAFRRDGIVAVSISDTMEGGALARWAAPARRAIAAGLDLVLYPNHESAAGVGHRNLVAAVQHGLLARSRVVSAATAVLALKARLGLRIN